MFDGAKSFGGMLIIVVVGLFLAWPFVGCWGLLGGIVGLYYLLSFFNSLERRDIDDAAKQRKPKRKG